MLKKETGITLVALIIVVGVMLIIASVSIYNGMDAINDTVLNGFYTQLEIVQERVEDIEITNESYIDENYNVINIKQAGKNLTVDQVNKLQNILASKGVSYANISDFRYFTIQDVKNILDLEEIDYNLFINFENRIVVAEEGITIEGTTYYMLEDTKYFVESNPSKNIGVIKSLKYGEPIKYGNDSYKVTIEPEEAIGDLNKTGYIKYKKTTSKYWDITNEKYIIIKPDIEYNIIFMDLNNNSIEKTIKLEYQKDEEGNLAQDENENNILIIIEK